MNSHSLECRENNFNLIRLLLAGLVLYSHCYQIIFGDFTYEPFNVLTGGRANFGEIAVDGFFAMSGFLVTMSWARGRGVYDFLRKRALRVYPGFIICYLFCAAVVAPLAVGDVRGYSERYDPARAIFEMATLQQDRVAGAFPSNPYPEAINASLWTISYEFGCYLILAGLGVLGILKRRRIVLALFLASLVFYAFRPPPFYFYTLPYWGRLVTFFLSGVTLYLYKEHVPFRRMWAVVAAVILAASLRGFRPLSLALPICGTYLLFSFAFSTRLKLYEFGTENDLSYGVYLYAYPMQQLIAMWLLGSLNPALLFALAAGPTLALAWLSWRFVERPFLLRKSRERLAEAGGHNVMPPRLNP